MAAFNRDLRLACATRIHQRDLRVTSNRPRDPFPWRVPRSLIWVRLATRRLRKRMSQPR